MFMNSVCRNLKNLREAKNYKQSYVADFLNISQQSYSRYENGQRELPIEYLPLISKLYSVSVDYILGVSMNNNDVNTLSKICYGNRTLKEIIDSLNYLNKENLSHVLSYIDFLMCEQNTNNDK